MLETFYGDNFALDFRLEWPEIPQEGDLLLFDVEDFQMSKRRVGGKWHELEEPLNLSGKYRVTERGWLIAHGEVEMWSLWVEPVSLPHLPEKHPLTFHIKDSS